MIENDTVRLLREIDAGIKMGISAIDEVREYVKCEDFGKKLDESKNEHKSLEREAEKLLDVDSLVKEAVENTKFIMIDR